MPKNYEGPWWGLIYDQMMMAGLAEWVENNRSFYHAALKDESGAVLECACGTGIYLLWLWEAGRDIYGFDISAGMLAALERKARAQGLADLGGRISLQEMESFHYDRQFAAILIPTNTFGMLTSQAAQIRTLRNIHAHLAPGGRLLLDLHLAGVRDLALAPEVVEGQWYTWTHPESGLPIRQRIVGRYDFDKQITLDQCFIEYEGHAEDFSMNGRWIFKEEFQLLLRLGGFERWEVFGTPEGGALQSGLEETHSYWIAHKD